MKKIITCLFFITALISTHVYALDGCANPKTQYDQTYCTGKLFIESDTELNKSYNALTKIITAATKKQLIASQRAWIKFRDDSCSQEGSINVDCNYSVNKARLEYFQDRIRECKTGHCQNDLIVAREFKTS